MSDSTLQAWVLSLLFASQDAESQTLYSYLDNIFSQE
jgi:hypothetical protein